MAKRTKKKKTVKRAKKTRPKKKKKSKAKARRPAKRKSAKKKSTAKRKSAARKRAPRRSEADMSWSEVRQSRRKKSDGRFARIEREFFHKVNMKPQALDRWLKSGESRAAATPHSANESGGHWSGRRVVEIMRKKKSGNYTPDDYAHMRKVIGFVARHSARRPDGDPKDSPWRHSLMNWGHDPMR